LDQAFHGRIEDLRWSAEQLSWQEEDLFQDEIVNLSISPPSFDVWVGVE